MFFVYALLFFLFFYEILSAVTKLYYFIQDLFYIPNKRFENTEFELSSPDDYYLLNYTIFYESGENIELDTLDEEIIKKFENVEEDVIKFIQINYLFKNKLFKYITYNKDITFPIYDVINNKIGKKITSFLIDDTDYTSIITPYLGPNNNFYLDKGVKFSLKDIFTAEAIWGPFTEENRDKAIVKIKDDNDGEILTDLNWVPTWKQYAYEM